MVVLRIALLILWVHYSFEQINWCDPKFECGGEKHTMCKYTMQKEINGTLGFSCDNMEDAATSESRQRLLGMHNYVRNYIAAGYVPGWPEASNMRQLTWDDRCAEVARMWAFQCQSFRDKCRKTPDFEEVGQNWGFALGNKGHPDGVFQVFKVWLDEIIFASGKIVGSYKPNARYDRFAAMVWAETHKVGCGLVNLTYTGSGEKTYRQVLVCNYATAGLKKGNAMWVKGDPCSKCPAGTQCNPNSTYPNLCASPRDPSDEIPGELDIPSCEPCRFNFVSVGLFALSVIFETSTIT